MSIDLSHDGDGVATVLMNRPQKRNAFTLDMYREFGRVMRELEADDAVRCVVLRGGWRLLRRQRHRRLRR